MKCFDVNHSEITRGFPIEGLSGITFGNMFLRFHPTLLNHGGDACFGNFLVNVDLANVFHDPGYDRMLVAPGADNDSAFVRIRFHENQSGTSRFSSFTVSEWHITGDAEEILSGTTSEVYGGGMDFFHNQFRVYALRIGKGAKMERKEATKSIEKRRFRKSVETITTRSTIISFDGNKVSIETKPE
ncbi:MAG TPA: hypothetical protein V6C76_04580 [Drouetiella sp.]